MKNKIFNLALASIEEDEVDTNVDLADKSAHTENEVNIIEVEMTSSGNRLESAATAVDDDIESAATEIATLEALRATLESVREEGLTPAGAQLMQTTLGAAQRRYGVTADYSDISLECFTGRESRTATSISLEGIKETINKIIEWIKSTFAKFVQWVRDLINQFTHNIEALREKNDDLKKRARLAAIKIGQKTEGEVALGGREALLSASGEFDPNKDITSNLQLMTVGISVSESLYQSATDEVMKRLNDVVHGKSDSLFGKGNLLFHLPSNFQRIREGSGGLLSADVYAGPLMPGGYRMLVYIPTYGNTTSSSDRSDSVGGGEEKIAVRVTRVINDGKVNGPVAAISLRQIGELCRSVDQVLAKMTNALNSYKTYSEKLAADLPKMLEKTRADSGIGENDRVGGEVVTKAVSEINSVGNVFSSKIMSELSKHAYRVCAAYIMLGEKSYVVQTEFGIK